MTVQEKDLPLELDGFGAVGAAYPEELTRIVQTIQQRLSVMVECEKEVTQTVFRHVRDRLRASGLQCIYLDGRPDPNGPPVLGGVVANLLAQVADCVRGAAEDRVIVLPHLDLLTTSTAGLTSTAQEAIALLHENPETLVIGFRDPSMPLPRVVEGLFPRVVSMSGIRRDRLPLLVTQSEARKFGKELDLYQLYKYVSGLNPVRLRRLLSAVVGEDYPDDPKPAFAQLRSATLTQGLEIPSVDLHKDIGGYKRVKDQIQREILDLMVQKDGLKDEGSIKQIEGLLPRGIIFHGPSGTGKTLFAKAMATSLGAAIQIISGPEIKSKWFGESEQRLRDIFRRARQSAPALIVFDELDSIAGARGRFSDGGGAGEASHSIVNQLLTEMDGFRKEELVFVIGTTNFVESLDPALLRPGRFEFHIHIPYPEDLDRKEIIEIYNRKFDLKMPPCTIEHTVQRTNEPYEATGSPYSGDHIQALCRQIARQRLRAGAQAETLKDDVDEAIELNVERPDFTEDELRTIATHEAGHAIVAMNVPHAPPIERVSIRGDLSGAAGFVKLGNPRNRFVMKEGSLLDRIAFALGGREAESLLMGELSIGAAHDLFDATNVARLMVEELGLGKHAIAVQHVDHRDRFASEKTKQTHNEEVARILREQEARAKKILVENKKALEALRDLLVEKRTLRREDLAHLGGK